MSYTDGLLSRKDKIIITTNQAIDTIDPALLRPGRCFDVLQLNPLSVEQAKEIWVDLFGLSACDLVTRGNTVTQAELMSQFTAIKTQREIRRYIRDPWYRNVSIEDRLHSMHEKGKTSLT